MRHKMDMEKGKLCMQLEEQRRETARQIMQGYHKAVKSTLKSLGYSNEGMLALTQGSSYSGQLSITPVDDDDYYVG